MKVLVATNMWPLPEAPSFGVFVKEQVEALRELGVDVEVSMHLGRRSRLNYPRGVFELAGHLRRERYDLIHSHHPYSTILAAVARRIAGQPRLPIVMTFHDGEVFRPRTLAGQGLLTRLKYSMRLKAAALRQCAWIIPTHPAMLARVLGETEAARVRATVIPAGIDLRRFGGMQRADARGALGWSAEEIAGQTQVVFFPAEPGRAEKRFHLAQGAADLLAADAAAGSRPPCRLLTGGAIPYEQIPVHMAAVDAVMITSAYETGPLVAREALACETAVVSTDVGDVRASYGDLAGVAVCEARAEALADGLRRVLDVPQPFGGRARIEALGLDRLAIARRVLEVYRQNVGLGSGV